MKKIFQILSFNIIVLIFLFFFMELGWRIALTIKNFDKPNLSYFGKTWYRANHVELGKFDKKLIKTLLPNIEILNVDIPRYEKNSRISSNKLGFRNNLNNLDFYTNKRILTVGDSFTFGAEVSDQSTWPSCLERKLKIITDNAGYPGYSAGQAIRKGIIESKKRSYTHIIWSIFFHDFERDFSKKLIVRDGDGGISFIQEVKKPAIKNNNKKKLLFDYFKEYFFIVYHINYKILPNIKNSFKKKESNIENELVSDKFYGIDFSLIEKNIEFLFSEFNKININKKIILYQYGEDFKNPLDNKIKQIIKKYNKDYNFLIIDTAIKFSTYNSKELKPLWLDHHTSYGNEVVCKYIIKKMVENKYISD